MEGIVTEKEEDLSGGRLPLPSQPRPFLPPGAASHAWSLQKDSSLGLASRETWADGERRSLWELPKSSLFFVSNSQRDFLNWEGLWSLSHD